MVETSTFKIPPTAPMDVPVGARAAPAVVQGRNTTTAEINKPINHE